jgi:hypothetical protein
LPEWIANLPNLVSITVNPDKMIYPLPKICKNHPNIKKYLQEMKELLPLLQYKIINGLSLTRDQRLYPYLHKWVLDLEDLCSRYPNSNTSKQILRLLEEKGCNSLKKTEKKKLSLRDIKFDEK